MIGADSFSRSYSEARDKFQEAVAATGGRAESFKHPRFGPGGEELAAEVAWFGPSDASRVLVLISGTHGVEGHCGSGAQIDWLRREEFKLLPADTGVLIIDAINPHGFAWTRRVNEDNIDVNRNWLIFRRLPPNPGYVDRGSPLSLGMDARGAGSHGPRYGRVASVARGAGGGRVPAGREGRPIYSPTRIILRRERPSWSRRTQSAIFQKYLERAKRVGVIDYHTGLGPCGYAELLTVFPSEAPEFKRAATWFGAAVTRRRAEPRPRRT